MPSIRHHSFARDDPFPSWFANAIQEYLSGLGGDVRLRQVNSTTVQVLPRVPLDRAAMPIQGRWRYIDGPVSRAYPGGSGTFDIWAVALDNNIDNSPDPLTDHTNYAFDLRITAHGVDPSGAGVTIFEKLGELVAAAGAITELRQMFTAVSGALLEDSALSDAGVTVVRKASGALELGFDHGAPVPSADADLLAGIGTWVGLGDFVFVAPADGTYKIDVDFNLQLVAASVAGGPWTITLGLLKNLVAEAYPQPVVKNYNATDDEVGTRALTAGLHHELDLAEGDNVLPAGKLTATLLLSQAKILRAGTSMSVLRVG